MYYGTFNMCNRVCGTMSRVQLSLRLSVTHCHVTFDWHSSCGSERCIILALKQYLKST